MIVFWGKTPESAAQNPLPVPTRGFYGMMESSRQDALP